jgi:hypothetical protein
MGNRIFYHAGERRMAKAKPPVEQSPEEKAAEAAFNGNPLGKSKTEIAKEAWAANPGKTAKEVQEYLAAQGHDISLPTVNNAKADRKERAMKAPSRPANEPSLVDMAEFLEMVKKDKDGAKKEMEMLENPLYAKIAQLGEENVKRFLTLVK